MNTVHPWPVDPSLLPVLEALLRERSVTRAAERLKLTQSSVSHALARLREALGDPLFVRSGRELAPTPRAEALAPAVISALDALRGALTVGARFDPETTQRKFVLASPDVFAALLPPLLTRFEREAPKAKLEARSSAEIDAQRALSEGSVDVVLGPARDVSSGSVRSIVGSASWCVLAREGHPALSKRDKLTIESWTQHGHIQVRTSAGPSFIGTQLASKKIARRVAFVAPSFLVAPMIAAQTDWFFTAPAVLVRPWAPALGLRVLDPPVALDPLPVALYWNERVDSDPAHRWFRRAILAVIEDALRGERPSKRASRVSRG
ncbi:MAG: LysR family transcriptional regulator [Polyangiales bacterium]